MSVTISPLMYVQFMNPNNSGSPAIGFKLFTYLAGTSTKTSTWTDSTQGVTNANPILLDANGAAYIWLDPTVKYKFVLANANDTDPPSSPLRTVDNIESGLTNSTTTQALLGQKIWPQTAAEIAAGVTPTNYAYPPGDERRYSVGQSTIQDAFTANATDIASRYLLRTAAYSGGTVGWVNSCLKVETDVTGTGITADEWTLLSILKNSATAGQNVAIYGQAQKLTGAGPTWAATFEAHDKSGNANPTNGLVGIEVDIFADGTDNNSTRVGIDVVGGVGVSIGPGIAYGVRIGPQNGNSGNCNFVNGLYIYGVVTTGINIASSGSSAVGITTANATLSAASYRMAAGQFLSFDANDTNRLKYDNTGIGYYTNSTLISRLNSDGSVLANNNTAIPAGGATSAGLKFSSTANFGVFFGSGAPTLSAAQGSLYVRSDGSSTSTRLYVNTNGTTGWTNFTSAT